MRYIGAEARGIRLPIITQGDDLPRIVVESLMQAVEAHGIELKNNDILGITEAIVAKAQGNFASVDDIAVDVSQKFGEETVGLVFPILSRNRFLNILKGISRGCKKLIVLLKYPSDEVGNPIIDIDKLDEIEEQLPKGPIPAAEFIKIAGSFLHPFTQMDYISLYEQAGNNIEVYLANDSREILKLTKNVLAAEIHERNRTKKRLLKAGAKKVYTLSDILSSPVNGSGYNTDYGVLGSNIATDETLKLFPRDSMEFAHKVCEIIREKTGLTLETLVYGDGAFKDPVCGIWELADPIVSPGYTPKLSGTPNEIKLKYVADNIFGDLNPDEKQKAITDMIKTKKSTDLEYREGTTPRKFADLLGSLCDLMSGSGDKGTPVILIQGYFDDYASK